MSNDKYTTPNASLVIMAAGMGSRYGETNRSMALAPLARF